MKRVLLADLVAVILLAGCMAGHAPHGGGVVVVPALPSIVVLDAEPYYQHGEYYYYYQNDRWSYSNSKGGPWMELPRDRYPKEVKFKSKGGDQGQGGDQGKGGDKGQGGDQGKSGDKDKGEKHGHDKD